MKLIELLSINMLSDYICIHTYVMLYLVNQI